MEITAIHITPVAMSDPPLRAASGVHAPYALRTIVELETDSGVSGVSEIPGSVSTNDALERARDVLLGMDPFKLNLIDRALGGLFKGAEQEERGDQPFDRRDIVHVRSAIEVACFDIMGKATGRPVADLLGGAVRDRVPFAAYLFYKHEGAGGVFGFGKDPEAKGWAAARQEEALSPESIVAQAQAMCAEFGFKSIKLKGGVLEPDIEVDTVLALREAFGPDVPLRMDPNAVWKTETAIRCGRRLEGVLQYFEDPTRGQENMAEVRKALSMPLATNMCTTSFEDLPSSIALGSEDIILSDHHYWGGLRSSLELARICRTFGRGLSMHSNSHLGISLAAMTHMAAAVPNLNYDLDTHYPWQREDVIVGGRLKFEEGSMRVPEGPGLGVEIDREALAQLHQNYLDCGLSERDDEVEMQKIEPGWKFMATRW